VATTSIAVVALGPFGHAVARLLASMRPGVAEAEPGGDPAAINAGAGAIILASWRPAPQLFDALDDECHKREKPLLPVLIDGTILRVGPLVIPGAGPCFRCWTQRLAQHASGSDPRLAVESFYGACEDATGPRGYLEAYAAVGAARACQILGNVQAGTAEAGGVWQMEMLSRRTTASVAAGIHGCSRCGLDRPEAERAFAAIRAAVADELADLWARPAKPGRGHPVQGAH